MTDITPLEAELRKLIRKTGPMPVWRYMQLCLTHPQHGYYVTRDPLGREGDFTTAPEVSQMFGELLGLWAASVWKAMGAPPSINLVELGPGNGTMMMDALRAIRVLPPFFQATQIHLVEINPLLRDKQKKALLGNKLIQWHDTIDQLPEGPSIILANEYFDVLPIHQAVKQETGWHERVIELDDKGHLVYGVAGQPIPRFEVLLPPLVRAAPNGAVFEWRPDLEMMKLARRIRDFGGAALIIDYGHVRSDAGDTFQAIARHSFADPLKTPGRADVTAHVDFQALARAADDVGARVHGPVEQGVFLQRLGIENRALTLMAKATHEVSEDIATALKRLIDSGRGGMGALFKVIGIADPSLDTLAGLTDRDTARDAATPLPLASGKPRAHAPPPVALSEPAEFPEPVESPESSESPEVAESPEAAKSPEPAAPSEPAVLPEPAAPSEPAVPATQVSPDPPATPEPAQAAAAGTQVLNLKALFKPELGFRFRFGQTVAPAPPTPPTRPPDEN